MSQPGSKQGLAEAESSAASLVVTEFPRDVRETETMWIPMSDGAKLAARTWIPSNALEEPVPAILEYLPYRRRDSTRRRDNPMHAYFAGFGYAAIRLDLRGTGDSDGLLADEYLEQEQDDALEAIAWIASQPWCSGRVGMIGKSWGGFNALQIAALRPPALGSIITVCSTDDRYADDVHYMGGSLLTENLEWGSLFLSLMSRPPDPEIVGSRWRAMWLDRMEHHGMPIEAWLTHQRRDAYWKHGSIAEDYGDITCPVLAVSGWADGYSNAVFRLMEHLKAPRRGLIGPWGHTYPHDGIPGPAIGFLQEAVRWWDRWLKGIDTGVVDEPMLTVWMQDSVEPARDAASRPGRWVGERTWPSPLVSPHTFALQRGALAEAPGLDEVLEISSPQSTGLGGIHWCVYGDGKENPGDQRDDDGRSLVFDSPPLAAGLEILGAPIAALDITVDRPVAMVAVRLNDVAPTGASTRVSFGILNLTHRDGHDDPTPLEPGRRYPIRVQLNEAAHAFPAGHRLRFAISTSYWPMVWPAPEPVRLSVHTHESSVVLPVRAASPEDARLRAFGPPEAASPLSVTPIVDAQHQTSIHQDLIGGGVEVFDRNESGLSGLGVPRRFLIDDVGLIVEHVVDRRYTIQDDDPLSAAADLRETIELERDDWQIRIETRMSLASTEHDFVLNARLEAFEGESLVHEGEWNRSFPRDLM